MLLMLHTLDVVAQHLPVALGTAFSKSLASLQEEHARQRMRNQSRRHHRAVLASMTLACPCPWLHRAVNGMGSLTFPRPDMAIVFSRIR
jgi:hypothetical protein